MRWDERSKLLDSDMSPLGFDAQQMFRFLSVRFNGTALRIQHQSLNWLHLLSSLHISVNISLLVNIFQEGVATGKLDEVTDHPGDDLHQFISILSIKKNKKKKIIIMNN